MQSRNLWNLWEPFFRKKFTQVFWGARTQVPFSLDILKASWVESFCSYKTSETIHNVECFFVRTSIWKFHKNATRKLWRKKRRRILLRRREAKITHEQHSEIVWWKKLGSSSRRKWAPKLRRKKSGKFHRAPRLLPNNKKNLDGKILKNRGCFRFVLWRVLVNWEKNSTLPIETHNGHTTHNLHA